MTPRLMLCAIVASLATVPLFSTDNIHTLPSPDGRIVATIDLNSGIRYSVSCDEKDLIKDTPISMTLTDGTVFGGDAREIRSNTRKISTTYKPYVYRKSEVKDECNELTMHFKKFDLVFRAYNDGVAYRFVSKVKGDTFVKSEQADWTFAKDWNIWVPYVVQHTESLESQYYNSFENTYAYHPISQFRDDRLAFLPVLVDADDGIKVCITESDLLNYPGMFLYKGGSGRLTSRFAPYPKDVEQGGHNRLQGEVKTRENYIAKYSEPEAFPWRCIIVSRKDSDLLSSDMVWRLGSPSKGDFSWVKPGKVAWDWWNDWNIEGVPFVSGINNDTYKYYIDFASDNDIEYVILDEGWSVNGEADLMKVVPEINLEELCSYAKEKGVGLILWAGYYALNKDIEGIFAHYSKMGIKGFKIDFMDRDDQQMLGFYTRCASIGAKYHLMVDFHGAFKPAGIHRTYPNVVNFEGVHGLEQMKWSETSVDQVTYDVTIPFIRQVAGPMDYTQGAMRNATRSNYRPVNNEPMSQGTRCRQLAEYVVFESPLNMMCDSPSQYMREMECTKFIAEIPTVWDETVPITGSVGQYVATARRKGRTWYIGALTNWDERDLTLDLKALGVSGAKMEIFCDGVNAGRIARDYRKGTADVPSDGKVTIHMAPGGGWVARIVKGIGK